MACNLFSTKPLSESVWDYYTLDPWEQLSVKFETKYNNSHAPQNEFQNVVCKTEVILSWPQYFYWFDVPMSAIVHDI